jgi:predicted TIM-barrel fold metal-dependent hydrolase
MDKSLQSSSLPIIDSHIALGEEHHLHLSERELEERMQRHGISLAIARPMGGELVVHNRQGNDRVLSAGSRVKGLVSVNPWYGVLHLSELERCKSRGAVGLYLHPTRQGFMPTDPVVEPFLQWAEENGWPVVFHTGTYINSDVLAVAEVARRHPEMTLVCDTAGFTDMWFELPGVLAEASNVMLCASLIWPRAITTAAKAVGATRVLFGSGEPRDSMEAALNRVDRLELSEADRRAILYENAKRVFKLS